MVINNTCPSARKMVKELNIDIEDAKVVRKVWGELDISEILERFPGTRAWHRSCYHSPSNREVRKNAIAELMSKDGYYGVETLGRIAATRSSRIGMWVDYLNAGDTYNATLFFSSGKMWIDTTGRLLESGYVSDDPDFLEGF